MATTGTLTIDVRTPDGQLIGHVPVHYEILGTGTCPECRRDTLTAVAWHHPHGLRLWTDCDHCNTTS